MNVIWWKLFDSILFVSVEIWDFDSLIFKCCFWCWKDYLTLLNCVMNGLECWFGWRFEINFVRLLKASQTTGIFYLSENNIATKFNLRSIFV